MLINLLFIALFVHCFFALPFVTLRKALSFLFAAILLKFQIIFYPMWFSPWLLFYVINDDIFLSLEPKIYFLHVSDLKTKKIWYGQSRNVFGNLKRRKQGRKMFYRGVDWWKQNCEVAQLSVITRQKKSGTHDLRISVCNLVFVYRFFQFHKFVVFHSFAFLLSFSHPFCKLYNLILKHFSFQEAFFCSLFCVPTSSYLLYFYSIPCERIFRILLEIERKLLYIVLRES